jgi:serine/threonine protein kinase
MKQIKVHASNPGDLNDKLHECNVIKNLKNPYICRFKQYFETDNMLCILFEYCDKGDLETFIINQLRSRISEGRIRRFAIEILLGIDYLHE